MQDSAWLDSCGTCRGDEYPHCFEQVCTFECWEWNGFKVVVDPAQEARCLNLGGVCRIAAGTDFLYCFN